MKKTLKYFFFIIGLALLSNPMNARTIAIVGVDQNRLPDNAANVLPHILPLMPTQLMGKLGQVIDILKTQINSSLSLVNAWDEARAQYIKNMFIKNKAYDEILVLTGTSVKEDGGETLLMQALNPEVDSIDVYALVHEGNEFWNFMGEEENIDNEIKNKLRFLYSESCHGASKNNPFNIISKAQKYGYNSIIAFNGLSSSPLITFEFINLLAQNVSVKDALEYAHLVLNNNLNNPQTSPIFSQLTQLLAGYSDKEQILSNTANTMFYNNKIAFENQTITSKNQPNKNDIEYNKINIQ